MTAPPLEREIQQKILVYLKSLRGTWWVKFPGGRFAPRGVPDILGCWYGRFFAFEVKRPIIGKTTQWQKRVQQELRAAGAHVYEVTSVDDVKQALRAHRSDAPPLSTSPAAAMQESADNLSFTTAEREKILAYPLPGDRPKAWKRMKR